MRMVWRVKAATPLVRSVKCAGVPEGTTLAGLALQFHSLTQNTRWSFRPSCLFDKGPPVGGGGGWRGVPGAAAHGASFAEGKP